MKIKDLQSKLTPAYGCDIRFYCLNPDYKEYVVNMLELLRVWIHESDVEVPEKNTLISGIMVSRIDGNVFMVDSEDTKHFTFEDLMEIIIVAYNNLD